MTTQDTTQHPFEKAGLGKAPFRFIGMVQQDLCYGEAILNRAEYERTGIALTTKPGGSCAFCGNYIVRMFGIESADGRRFHVGCDCVEKTGDRKLSRSVKQAELAANRFKRETVSAAKREELMGLLSDAATREMLASATLPNGRPMLDWADWVATHAGAAGRAKALKAIKLAMKVTV